MDLEAIQQAIADAAGVISGLQTAPALTDSIDPPTFAPVEHEISYQTTFGTPGLTEIVLTCGLFVSRGDADAGRALLAHYLEPSGSTSIRAAMETDRTLGGVAKALIVERVRGSGRTYTVGGTDYVGAMFEIRIWA